MTTTSPRSDLSPTAADRAAALADLNRLLVQWLIDDSLREQEQQAGQSSTDQEEALASVAP